MRKSFTALLVPLLAPGAGWSQAPGAHSTPSPPSSAIGARMQNEPHPAIWLLSDDDTRIYIFGTLHALSPDLRWRSPAFDRIAREASELALEVSDADLRARGPNPFTLMQMSKSVPILQRVSPDRRDRLAQLLRELEIPESAFDRFETWGVAALLSGAKIARASRGIVDRSTPAAGVEAVLMRDFHARGLPISGAESPSALIGSFRDMPLEAQQALLDDAVDAYFLSAQAGAPDEEAWAQGDFESVVRAVDTIPPRLYELLITRRNRNFADWLARRLDRPGTVLFAIGAGHLAGRVSVQSMLESRGLHVQRIY